MRASRRVTATVGLVLTLGLVGCGKTPEDPRPVSSRGPTGVVGRVTAQAVTCPVGDTACRAPRAVRWSVPVDLPVAVTATKEHSRSDWLAPYDGTTPQDGWDRVEPPEDYALVATSDVVRLRANGRVLVVSADTGIVEYTGDAAGYAAFEDEPAPLSGVDPERLGLVDANLLRAGGSPVVDGVPLVVAVGCVDATIDHSRPISDGAPSYVGYCAAPVLFALNQ